jgi:hypothetical protein
MDAQMLKSLKLLDEFLSQTPKDELEALFEKYAQMNFGGPTVAEYLQYLEHTYPTEVSGWTVNLASAERGTSVIVQEIATFMPENGQMLTEAIPGKETDVFFELAPNTLGLAA